MGIDPGFAKLGSFGNDFPGRFVSFFCPPWPVTGEPWLGLAVLRIAAVSSRSWPSSGAGPDLDPRSRVRAPCPNSPNSHVPNSPNSHVPELPDPEFGLRPRTPSELPPPNSLWPGEDSLFGGCHRSPYHRSPYRSPFITDLPSPISLHRSPPPISPVTDLPPISPPSSPDLRPISDLRSPISDRHLPWTSLRGQGPFDTPLCGLV